MDSHAMCPEPRVLKLRVELIVVYGKPKPGAPSLRANRNQEPLHSEQTKIGSPFHSGQAQTGSPFTLGIQTGSIFAKVTKMTLTWANKDTKINNIFARGAFRKRTSQTDQKNM